MSKNYVYVLYEFDSISEKLKRRIEIPNCSPELVREQFAPNETEKPYIFDIFPIKSYQQILILAPYLANEHLDFSKNEYFFEANQKNP